MQKVNILDWITLGVTLFIYYYFEGVLSSAFIPLSLTLLSYLAISMVFSERGNRYKPVLIRLAVMLIWVTLGCFVVSKLVSLLLTFAWFIAEQDTRLDW